jgi:hypothetical protein
MSLIIGLHDQEFCSLLVTLGHPLVEGAAFHPKLDFFDQDTLVLFGI